MHLYSAVAAHSWVGNKVVKTELNCLNTLKDIILLCSLRQMNCGLLFKIKFTFYICMLPLQIERCGSPKTGDWSCESPVWRLDTFCEVSTRSREQSIGWDGCSRRDRQVRSDRRQKEERRSQFCCVLQKSEIH